MENLLDSASDLPLWVRLTMLFGVALILLGLFMLIDGPRWRRALRAQIDATGIRYGQPMVVESKPDEKWNAPPLGFKFIHCDLRLIVVGTRIFECGCWKLGVVCHYRDDRGRIRQVNLSPETFDALEVWKRKPSEPTP